MDRLAVKQGISSEGIRGSDVLKAETSLRRTFAIQGGFAAVGMRVAPMKKAGATGPGLLVTLFPSGEHHVLARGDFHGRWLRWLDGNP